MTRDRDRRPSWWFAVAPAGAVLVVATLATAAPLQVRWELSQPQFDAAVQEMTRDKPDEIAVTDTARIGLYEVTYVTSVEGGILFYEANGSLFDDAGFAYLPNGPSPQMESGDFEDPAFQHLGGPWYAFTASW
jgi:hypothetical protein